MSEINARIANSGNMQKKYISARITRATSAYPIDFLILMIFLLSDYPFDFIIYIWGFSLQQKKSYDQEKQCNAAAYCGPH
jgi:hypothetical protein